MKLLQLLKGWLQKLGGVRFVKLPTVSAVHLAAAKNDEDYLQLLLEAYEQQVSPAVLQNRLDTFTDEACIFILFSSLSGQVNNGGFIQLIQNGYGPNLFGNPFAKDIATWGATELAEVVEQASAIYKAHQPYLERERTIPEFSKLYQEFRAFEPLEQRFYEVIDDQTAIIRAYIERHIAQFVCVE